MARNENHDNGHHDHGPYRSLDRAQREIRILHLEPGTHDDIIRTSLEVVSLNDPPDYAALSYAWGTALSQRTVVVDGVHNLAVTENLDCALRHLRLEDHPLALWIDALCMNQEDLLERSHQVQLMGHVYGCASRVIIWLGPDPGGDFGQFWNYLENPVDVRSEELFFSLLQNFLRMSSAPWFSRVWVAQELALSANDPEICLGHRNIYWSDAIHALKILNSHLHHSWMPDQNQIDLMENSGDRYERLSRFHGLREPKKKQSLHGRLQETQFLQASNARDKVYGILGITSLSDDDLVPDYTLTVRAVFTHAVIAMLKSGDTQLYRSFPLYYTAKGDVVRGELLHDLPSWVPDLSLLSQMGDQHSDWKTRYWDPSNMLGYDDTQVVGRPRNVPDYVAKFDIDKGIFYAIGEILGHLEWCSTPQSFRGHDKAQKLYELFCAAEVNGFQPDTFEKVASQTGQLRHPKTSSEPKEVYEQRLRSNLIPGSRPSGRQRDMYQAARYQTLFTTASGHCGKSYHPDPTGIKVGDVLFGFFGVDFPFLLRPIGDSRYAMINVAYVPGYKWSVVSHKGVDSLKEDWSNLGDLGLQAFEIV